VIFFFRLFRAWGAHSFSQKTRVGFFPFGKKDSLLPLSMAMRLALGFFLAAILAVSTTWIIGSQHAAVLSQQSNFYQALLRINTTLTDGGEILKALDNLTAKTLADATSTDASALALDKRALASLSTRYDDLLRHYAASDLLSQHPDQITLLGGGDPQVQVEQQRTYTAGALQTWQVYLNAEKSILADVTLGKIAQAQSLARLQGEPAFADALSSLHSLIQFNEQLATLVDEGANNATTQQLLNALLASFLAFLGIAFVGFIISQPLTRRLKQLYHVTQAIKQGQMDTRVSVVGSDEIASVSSSVNTMLDALVDAIQQTTAAKQQVDHAYQQQRQLNEMKDRFIQNVSHELRTPLTEIYGFLELLHEHWDQWTPSQQILFLRKAIKGCEELNTLFTTILDAADVESMVQSPQTEKLLLFPIVQSLSDLCDPRETENHPITLEVPEDLTLYADAQYLRQVLRNLVSNACKYTPPQTPIFISAKYSENASEASPEPSHVYICVKDNGPGIPPEEQGFLFQQFVRLKRDLSGTTRGTGLGLYLCRQFVEAMHGHIWVESSGIAGEGSSFCFTLPAISPSSLIT
jgi:signal transduction histidine kinase